MSELILDRDERLRLRARAHHLNPVVLLGAAGLTEAVVKETDRALAAHELIKVRIPGDDRDGREAIGAELAQRLGAARVQAIGKLLVLYRPRPEEDEAAIGGPSARSGGRPAKSAPRPAAAAKPAIEKGQARSLRGSVASKPAAAEKPASARASARPPKRPASPDRPEAGKPKARKALPGVRRSSRPSRSARGAAAPAGRRGGGRPR